jgi:hypothetical protein
MLEMPENIIGGARVVRTFNMNGEYTKRGDQLTREEVLAINLANRRALIDSNFIELYPMPNAAANSERFIVGIGNKQFNVIEGRVMNAEPLSRDEAELLMKS